MLVGVPEREAGLSPIERVFNATVANEVAKHGTKYEQLAALVYQILNRDSVVHHDVRLRGDGKRTAHQIDVMINGDGHAQRVIIECRDKDPGNKVGLAEARSFATVVRHLGARGVMVTTSGYTAGAIDLGEDEGIDLQILRAFTPDDADGRVKEIRVSYRIVAPEALAVRAEVVQPTPVAEAATQAEQPHDSTALPGVITASGNGDVAATTLDDLLMQMMAAPLDAPPSTGRCTAVRQFTPPMRLRDKGVQLVVSKLEVDYQVHVIEHEIVVGPDRVAALLLRSVDGAFDRVIRKDQLREYTIEPTPRGPGPG